MGRVGRRFGNQGELNDFKVVELDRQAVIPKCGMEGEWVGARVVSEAGLGGKFQVLLEDESMIERAVGFQELVVLSENLNIVVSEEYPEQQGRGYFVNGTEDSRLKTGPWNCEELHPGTFVRVLCEKGTFRLGALVGQEAGITDRWKVHFVGSVANIFTLPSVRVTPVSTPVSSKLSEYRAERSLQLSESGKLERVLVRDEDGIFAEKRQRRDGWYEL